MLYGASRPHTECFITYTAHTVHAITNLLCFSSVKHKTMLYIAVLYDSYSMASSFDPPTQNTINNIMQGQIQGFLSGVGGGGGGGGGSRIFRRGRTKKNY